MALSEPVRSVEVESESFVPQRLGMNDDLRTLGVVFERFVASEACLERLFGSARHKRRKGCCRRIQRTHGGAGYSPIGGNETLEVR